MRISEIDSYTPPSLDVGDDLLIGKFKNRKARITGFAKDDHEQPVLKTTKGDQKLFKPRIPKLMTEETATFKTLLPISLAMVKNFQQLLPHVRRHLNPDRNLIYVYASTVLTSANHPLAVPGSDACGINLSLSLNGDQIRLRIIEITSNQKGMGANMFKASLDALPAGSEIYLTDMSGGFWQKMSTKYPNFDWKI
jgi:hypothetical protein